MIRKRLAFENRPHSLARFSRGAGATLAVVIFFCAVGLVAPVPGTALNANASSMGVPSCSTSELNEMTSTSLHSYGPRTMVVMRASIRNVSSTICIVAIGPSSPLISVINANGVVVWNSCYTNDRHGACALYLVAQTLNPGATYTKTVAWDQRFGEPPVRDSPGAYQMNAQFSSIAGIHATKFQLTTTPSPRSISITQAENGRSISLHVGGYLFIELTGPAISTWTTPISSNRAVLARSVGTPGTIATATFVAMSSGNVRVTAVDNPNCYPQCLIPSRLFVLTVSVIS